MHSTVSEDFISRTTVVKMSLRAEDDEDLTLSEYDDLYDEDYGTLDLTGRLGEEIEMPFHGFHGLPCERVLFDFDPGSVVKFVTQSWEMNEEGDSFSYLWLYEICTPNDTKNDWRCEVQEIS